MRVAVIDLGTNTFHLIVAELSAGGINVLYKTNEPVKLGEGTINENRITEAAFERGIKALTGFKAAVIEYGVKQIKATATAAVRGAENGAAFVYAAKQRTGIEIDIITGDEEADYIFKGVKASGAIESNSLIMDIGGGSTEFILCDAVGLLWKKSYNIGAARLMQAFFKSDPLNNADAGLINDHLAVTLVDLKQACGTYLPRTLIGSAGAFETFAEMLSPDLNVSAIKFTGISFEGYKQLAEKFIQSTHAERATMKGLIPLRIDMIVMAALITNYVLDFTGIEQLKLSTYDLKMGILESLKNN